jgi:hypothetical protein
MSDVRLPDIPEKFRLTPEFRLLVACSWIAPPELEQEQADRIVSLSAGGIKWDVFLSLVRRHGVSSLAYTLLGRYAAGQMTDGIRAGLKADNIQTVGQSMLQSVELVRLGTLFAEHSVTPIVMKGVLLAQRLYGNPTLRNSADIDLMVRLEDFDRTDKLLREDGYECTSPGSNLTERQKSFFQSVGQNFEYYHAQRGIALELHWRSYLWSREQTDILWEHREPVSFMGQTFNTWDNESLLLTLCYHGAHHEWCCLKWTGDIAVLLSQGCSGGWESLLRLSEQLGMRRVLAQSALLVHWLYGIPLPGVLHALIREEKSSLTLAAKAINSILQTAQELASAGKRLDGLRHARYLVQLGLPQFEIMKGMIIKYHDFKAFPLPNGLFWLYIPLRPVLWFWRNYMSPNK